MTYSSTSSSPLAWLCHSFFASGWGGGLAADVQHWAGRCVQSGCYRSDRVPPVISAEVFALFIWLEIFLRIHLLKCAGYWCGPERYWNYFDQFLAATGVADISLQIASDGQTDIAGASLLRFCRLIRLVRIVKLFRVKFMKDLRLMVKGLLAGIRTLALAFALLFAVLYVISGFATITLGANPIDGEDGLHRYFANIPESMFTAFRCFTGECISDAGRPIQALLAEKFGLAFVLPYVACYMLVSMGIFNVILAAPCLN